MFYLNCKFFICAIYCEKYVRGESMLVLYSYNFILLRQIQQESDKQTNIS